MKYSILLTICSAIIFNSLSAATINTIEELDDAALFSFSIISDGQGSSTLDYQAGNTDDKSTRAHRADTWVKENAAFCLGVGDHFLHGRGRKDDLWKNDSWWHSSMYPIVADHDNDMAINGVNGKQWEWGRGAHLFTFLDIYNRSHVEFRQPEASKIYSNEGDHANAGYYDDKKVDYYARLDNSVHPKIAPGFTFHVLGLHWGDSSTFAKRSKDFMVSKMQEIVASKTDYDIIIVLIHQPYPWDYALSRGHMNWSEVNLMMNNADLTCYASTHKWGRDKRYDGTYDGTESFYMNTGCVIGGSFAEVHVFDNPPRMTIQCLQTKKSSRSLHVDAYNTNPDHDYPGDQSKPWVKEVNGPMYLANWNSFDVTPPANNAQFVSYEGSVPTQVEKGQTFLVSVKMKNTGDDTWSSSTGHKLGSQNPNGNNTWGLNRVQLPNNVSKGQEVTFTFNVTAPNTDGYFNFQWGMVDDGGDNVGWFGQSSNNVRILVGEDPHKVRLYADYNYGGWEAGFGVGSYTRAQLEAGGAQNNDLDSVRVADGYQIQLFDGEDFTGKTLILTADDPTLDDDGWHNDTSSFIVSTTAPRVNPVVSFELPPGDVILNVGDSLSVEVSATDADGIDRVRLYIDGVELARSEGAAPYEWSGSTDPELSNLQIGSFVLTAKATDSVGDVGEASINVSVVEAPSVNNLIVNGSFEGGTTGWTMSSSSEATISADVFAHGNYSLKNAPEADGYIPPTRQTVPVVPNSDYQFSYYINRPSGSTGAFTVRVNPGLLVKKTNYVSTTSWEYHEFSFNSGAESEVSIEIYGDGGLTDVVYVDNFQLIGPAVVADPFENWKSEKGVTDENSDDDNDGLSNVLEFALGGEPDIAVHGSQADLKGQRPEVLRNGNNVEFCFHRAEATVTYTIEKSTELVNWSDYVTVTDTHGTVGSDAMVSVPNTEMNNGKLFLRLKVQN